jgi:hypothetical protein
MKLVKGLLMTSLVFALAACGDKPSVNNSSPAANSNNSAPAKLATPQQVADIRSIDFLSETYETSACKDKAGLPKTIKFTAGKFQQDKANSTFAEIRGNKVTWGDLDGDGVEEALVAFYCANTNTNKDSFEIQVFTAENKKPKLVARLDGTRVEDEYKKDNPKEFVNAFNAREVKDGRLIVKVTTGHEPVNPSYMTTFTYKLSNGKFVLEGKPSKVPIGSKTTGESGK